MFSFIKSYELLKVKKNLLTLTKSIGKIIKKESLIFCLNPLFFFVIKLYQFIFIFNFTICSSFSYKKLWTILVLYIYSINVNTYCKYK